ncbi:MAG: nucleotide exchange factor GrpE [Anaerovoracaceae bacterium]|jgi:molecular chaperone GrpE
MTKEEMKKNSESSEAENEEAKAAEDDAAAGGDDAGKKNPGKEEKEELADTEKTDEESSEESSDEEDEDDARYGELNKKYMRLAADFQNFKRRTEKEKSDIYQYANEKIALDIIEVMDNFERALRQGAECEDKKFVEGVEKIYKQMKGVLEKNNIAEIEAKDKEFDPNFHNAVMAEDNPDYESGIVIEDMQKGYTLNGKVIRPSMVKVAK